HEIDVRKVQNELSKVVKNYQNEILQIPVVDKIDWSPEQIQEELNNSAQTLLGYVVRWVDQAVGCAKVLDINNVGLMADRATERISSQMLANWLHHGVCSDEQMLDTLKHMA